MGKDGYDYSEDQATLGDRLTAAREAAGRSVPELADALGVRAATVAGWEADKAEPRAVFLGRLSGMLGVTLVWLLTGQGHGPGSPADRREATRAELRELRLLLEQAAQRVDRIEELMNHG